MLPANRDDQTVHVHRSLDADEEDLLDAITAFAQAQSLEVDRRHEGHGLLFCATTSGDLFKKGDTLQVAITATDDGHDVEFVADIQRSIAQKSENRTQRVIRGYALAGLFAFLGARGLIRNGADFGDFVLFAISAGFGRRAFGRSQSAAEKIDDLQRKVANELNAVCDEAERA
jgi:hypothetical protein